MIGRFRNRMNHSVWWMLRSYRQNPDVPGWLHQRTQARLYARPAGPGCIAFLCVCWATVVLLAPGAVCLDVPWLKTLELSLLAVLIMSVPLIAQERQGLLDEILEAASRRANYAAAQAEVVAQLTSHERLDYEYSRQARSAGLHA